MYIYIYCSNAARQRPSGLHFSLSLREKFQSSSLGLSSRLTSMKEKGSIFSSFSFPQSNQILTILSALPAKVTPRGCRRIAMKWRWLSACSSFQPHTFSPVYEQQDFLAQADSWPVPYTDLLSVGGGRFLHCWCSETSGSEASGYSARLLPISLHLSRAFILWPLCDVLWSDWCRGRVNGDSPYTSSANVLQPPQFFWSSNEPLFIISFAASLSLHAFYIFSCFLLTQFLSPLPLPFSVTLILIRLNVSSLHRENEWIKQTFRLMREKEMEWGKSSAVSVRMKTVRMVSVSGYWEGPSLICRMYKMQRLKNIYTYVIKIK